MSNMGSNTIQAEFDEIERRNDWSNAYQDIKDRSDRDAKEHNYTVDESSRQHNRRFNRYRDVNPYDHSRIVLSRGDTDYINANLVRMDRANRRYILTQGPLQNTVSHFWAMVWEQNSRAILMLNKIIEKKQVKCHMYWPEAAGADHRMQLTDVGLCVELLRSEEYENYTKRVLRLSDAADGSGPAEAREVLQFQYNTWPDFGVPSTPMAFLQFLKQVRSSGALAADVGPPIVHCSAGIGRSGTFCLVDSCLVLFDNDNKSLTTVKDVLLELRRFRLGLIQTAPQLYFSYKAIIEGIRHFNDPSFTDYEEVPIIPTESELVAPPLPPPRTESLSTGHAVKPLPSIPYSVSVHELDLENRNQTIDAMVTPSSGNNGVGQRPLPPLPAAVLNSLQSIDEPVTTDEDALDEDDDDDDEDDDVDSDSDNENVAGISSDSNDDDANVDVDASCVTSNGDDDDCSSSNDVDMNESTPAVSSVAGTAVNRSHGNGGVEESFDANSTLPPSPTDKSAPQLANNNGDVVSEAKNTSNTGAANNSNSSSEATELRRRKRQERQTAIEERVREIKRRQHDAEEAPKKRRRKDPQYSPPAKNEDTSKSRC